MSWSSGKDSALALHEVRAVGEVKVAGLLTTVKAAAGRVAMHGVRRVLLEAQAAAPGLPLHVVELPWQSPATPSAAAASWPCSATSCSPPTPPGSASPN
jgi:diphthamide synthase (EF-2-diphthine--ammonia ligase)